MAVKPPAADPEPDLPGPGISSPALTAAAGRVDRAAADLRHQPDPGWDQVRDQMLAAVRRVRRFSYPVRGEVVTRAGAAGEVMVSEQVLGTLIGRAVTNAHPCTTDDVTLALDRSELRGVTITLRARYGQDLYELGQQVRTTVLRVLAEVLGSSVAGAMTHAVAVSITDVTVADPRTV